MRRQERLEVPAVLRDGAPQWNAAWTKRRSEGKKWRWPVKDGSPINQTILGPLRSQTASHCSFCDGFPVPSLSVETIEHFRPKSAFPELAFEWSNLFYCCTRCQTAKKERFSEELLKPDQAGYEFVRYFAWDYTTGEILPNPTAGTEEQRRAAVTIAHYRLNDHGLPDERRRHLGFRLGDETSDLDTFAYRDFLGR